MTRQVEELEADESEDRLERVAAVDVAKASGKVCTRTPHLSGSGRRVTRIWDVASTTNAIMAVADELAEANIERVVLESTSDYWRPFYYLLEARVRIQWVCAKCPEVTDVRRAKPWRSPVPKFLTREQVQMVLRLRGSGWKWEDVARAAGCSVAIAWQIGRGHKTHHTVPLAWVPPVGR